MPTKKTVAKKSATKKKTTKPAAKKVTKKPVSKKVTKKSTAKKTTPKKKSSKKTATKHLVYSSNEQSFWTTNGEILNSLVALSDALDRMEKDVYQFHAEGDQNDFALWVDVVLCDSQCAKALQKAKTPKSARTVVVRHLKSYSI